MCTALKCTNFLNVVALKGDMIRFEGITQVTLRHHRGNKFQNLLENPELRPLRHCKLQQDNHPVRILQAPKTDCSLLWKF